MQDNRHQNLPQATLFSLESTWRLIGGNILDSDMTLLKGAALLYPKIVVHTEYGYNRLCEQVAQGLNKKQKLKIRGFLQYASALAHKDSIIEAISKTGMVDHNIIKPNVESMLKPKPPGGTIEIDAIDYINPVLLVYINQYLKLPYYESKEDWEFLSQFFRSNFKIKSDEAITTFLPNLDNLNWESILELRESPFVTPFRKFMFGASNDKNELLDKVQKSLWEVVGISKPSIGKSTIRRIIANIPMAGTPFPNPYAVYHDIKDIVMDKETLKKYGWLFFIYDVKTKTN